jgi:hypothetical protein
VLAFERPTHNLSSPRPNREACHRLGLQVKKMRRRLSPVPGEPK